MPDQQTLENRIRDSFPIAFGKASAVDDATYLSKRNDVIAYAAAVSAPVLAPETVRYQTILMNVSLVMVSLSLFNIGKFSIADQPVTVDRRFLLFYGFFIVMIIVIFLIKAYVDFRRVQFTREQNAETVEQLNNLLALGRLRATVQEYFWLTLFDEIGATYKSYSDATDKALNRKPEFKHDTVNFMRVNLDELRKIPELSVEIDRQQLNLGDLRQELARDAARFNDRAETIRFRVEKDDANSPSDDFSRLRSDHGFSDLQVAFGETIGPWFAARNTLIDEYANHHVRRASGSIDMNRLDDTHGLLTRMMRIRKIYFGIEILAPVAFAIFAIAWVGFFLPGPHSAQPASSAPAIAGERPASTR